MTFQPLNHLRKNQYIFQLVLFSLMELSDSGMNIIKQSIGGGSLQWVTQDYRNYGFNASLATSETSLSIQKRIRAQYWAVYLGWFLNPL